MSSRFFIYALIVTAVSTMSSWGKMLSSASNTGSGSSWSSHGGYYGGGGYGGGYGGGGGHK